MTVGVVELTETLVSRNTVNDNEESAADVIAPLLHDAGFTIDLLPQATGRASLLAEWGIDGDKAPPLCLSGHLDTVPPGAEAWTTSPFRPERDGDRLYGRGTTDMKGGVAALVVASLEVVRRSSSSRVAATPGLRLLLTSGEESGCLGAKACVPHLAPRPAGPILIAEPTGNEVYNGHKGVLWTRLEATGVAAHGSCPDDANNAVLKLVEVLHELSAAPPAPVSHPILGVSTMNVSTFHGGEGINVVPDAANATIDLRTVAGQEHEPLLRAIAMIAGERADALPLLDLPAVWTDLDDDWSRRIHSIANRVRGREPATTGQGASYFTDGAVLRTIWPDATVLICGPGEPTAAHTTDEWCSVIKLEEAVEIYREAIRDWCHL